MKVTRRLNKKNNSYLLYGLLFFVLVALCLIVRIRIIDAQIKNYPEWIDPTLMPILHKKRNDVPLWYKMVEVFYTRGRYMDWHTLEQQLDILVEKIKATSIPFDAMVGIKSGGAIVTKYIATKLGLPYYYVKLSDKDYNCNKKPLDTGNYFYKKLTNTKKQYIVCEAIQSDLKNKTILLFDELILSGNTLLHTINYLLEEKKVKKVVPATIFKNKETYADYNPLYLKKGLYDSIWSWGYDN
jgi:hypoxanthine phosphoribosyltransferase